MLNCHDHSERVEKLFGGKCITLLSVHPNLQQEERMRQREAIEAVLYDIFIRYEKQSNCAIVDSGTIT